MKLLVIGAAGKLGQAIVHQAIVLGHSVTAFVHDAEKYHAPDSVNVFAGDVQNPTKVEKAIEGQDAVIDALGGHTPFKETTLETTAARIIISKMRDTGARRLVVISALGEGESRANTGFFYEHLLMPTFLRGAMKDKAEMESAVQSSGLDWVILRPGLLKDGDPKGNIRIFTPDTEDKAGSITRADVAAFALEQLTGTTYLGQAVTIANG